MPLIDSNDPAAKNGKVRSHRFAAANTALPFVNGDAVQLTAGQDFLRDGQGSRGRAGELRGAQPFPRAGRVGAAVFGIARSAGADVSAAGRSQAWTEPR